MTLADHTTLNSQSTDDDINTAVDLTQFQLNRRSSAGMGHWSRGQSQNTGQTDPNGQNTSRDARGGRIQHSCSDVLSYGRIVSMEWATNQVNSAVAQ